MILGQSIGLCHTYPILLFSLQLFDALKKSFFSTVQVSGKACNGDYVGLELRSRHLNIDLEVDKNLK